MWNVPKEESLGAAHKSETENLLICAIKAKGQSTPSSTQV